MITKKGVVLRRQAVTHPPRDLVCRRAVVRPHVIVDAPDEEACEVVLLHVSAFGSHGFLRVRSRRYPRTPTRFPGRRSSSRTGTRPRDRHRHTIRDHTYLRSRRSSGSAGPRCHSGPRPSPPIRRPARPYGSGGRNGPAGVVPAAANVSWHVERSEVSCGA